MNMLLNLESQVTTAHRAKLAKCLGIRDTRMSFTSPEVVARASNLAKPGETVLVILDSCHTRAHVLAELESYHGLVTRGSYIVATDGLMQDLHDVPLGRPDWREDNPAAAARAFAAAHPEFALEQPAWLFNESGLTENITHWPSAYLRRL